MSYIEFSFNFSVQQMIINTKHCHALILINLNSCCFVSIVLSKNTCANVFYIMINTLTCLNSFKGRRRLFERRNIISFNLDKICNSFMMLLTFSLVATTVSPSTLIHDLNIFVSSWITVGRKMNCWRKKLRLTG